MSRTFIIVKRMVQVLVVLNLWVLALLVLITWPGGEATPDVAAGAGDVTPDVTDDAGGADPTEPTPTLPDESPDVEVADDTETSPDPVAPVVDDGTGGTDTAVDDVPVAAVWPPTYPDPFEPTENEVQSDAKRLGSLVAYVITNYEVNASLSDVVGSLPLDAADYDAVALEVNKVHHPGMWSRGTVEYAQLGGHLNGKISLIVVVEQALGVEGNGVPERIEKRTMDIRLARGETGAWEFEAVASAGGEPIERPADLSPLAAAVVDNPRIDLPDTGIWDIYHGWIDPATLSVMHDIAAVTPYSVVVLQTGHSYNVFETNRVSNHSVGRAVDIYKLETELVIDAHDERSQFYSLSEWLVTRDDLKEFGSPWRFPDAVVHTFTNEVHHDHLHIGVFPAGSGGG